MDVYVVGVADHADCHAATFERAGVGQRLIVTAQPKAIRLEKAVPVAIHANSLDQVAVILRCRQRPKANFMAYGLLDRSDLGSIGGADPR